MIGSDTAGPASDEQKMQVMHQVQELWKAGFISKSQCDRRLSGLGLSWSSLRKKEVQEAKEKVKHAKHHPRKTSSVDLSFVPI